MRKNGGYRWVKVRLEEEVIEEIKDRGFALTEFVELATLLALQLPELASRRDYIRAFLAKISIDVTQKNNWSPGRGLNPRPAFNGEIEEFKKSFDGYPRPEMDKKNGGGVQENNAPALAALYAENRENFKAWLRTKASEETTKDYLSAMDRFVNAIDTIDSPAELRNLTQNKSKHLILALRNFLHFLKESYLLDKQTARDYLEVLKTPRSRVREVYLTDDEVKNAYERNKARGEINETIFLLLYFSGARASSVYALIQEFDPRKLYTIKNDGSVHVARYALHLYNNTKRQAYVYAPLFIYHKIYINIEELKKLTYDALYKRIQHHRVTANTIRKFFYTKALEAGVPADVIDFVQGRTLEKVGSRVYLDKLRLADKYYTTIARALLQVLNTRDAPWGAQKYTL